MRTRIQHPFLLVMLLLILAGIMSSIYISRLQIDHHMTDL